MTPAVGVVLSEAGCAVSIGTIYYMVTRLGELSGFGIVLAHHESIGRQPRTGDVALRTIILRTLAIFCFLPLLVPVHALAQTAPAAYVRPHSIFVGGEYALFDSDYFANNKSLNQPAFAVYGDYYILGGSWPVALELNYTKVPDHYGAQQRYLSSFLAGPKISHRMGRFEPFAKFGGGIGHFGAANVISYHQQGEHAAIGIGGGIDYHLTGHITLRPIDYTFERWNFYPHALSPQILGFGLSYRIH